MTRDEQAWMVLKDQYAQLARAAGSPSDSWFGDPLESHEEVLARIKELRSVLMFVRKRLEYYGTISDRRHFDHDLAEVYPKIEAALNR